MQSELQNKDRRRVEENAVLPVDVPVADPVGVDQEAVQDVGSVQDVPKVPTPVAPRQVDVEPVVSENVVDDKVDSVVNE